MPGGAGARSAGGSPAGRTGPVAVGLSVGGCLPGPVFLTSPTRALTIGSLYFSPFPSSSTAAEGRPARPRPARQCPPAGSCALPGFAAGSEPSSRGYNARGQQKAKAAGARTLGFPSPTFLSWPTGMCSSSSLRPAPRGNTAWGPKNYKSLHPPRRGRKNPSAGHFWCSMVGNGNEQRERWGTAVPSLGGEFTGDLSSYLICTTNLRGTVVSSLENAQLLARDHKPCPRWWRWD